MKFLCPSCKAKYQIADEKVSGRSVRMKCRKCGFVIPISEVPPAPPSIVPGVSGVTLPDVPKVPPPPVVTEGPARTPRSSASVEASSPAPPRVEAKPAPRRPTLSDVKSAPVKPPPPSSSPRAAPAPSPSVAAVPAPRVPPAKPAPIGPATGLGSMDLLASLSEEEEEQTRMVSGGALAAAFGQLVSEDAHAPASEGRGMTADEWFVGINDVPVGPIRLSEIRKRAMLGAITADSLVWRDGLEAWRPLRAFPELVAVLEESMSSLHASAMPLVPPASRAEGSSSGFSPGGTTSTAGVTDDVVVAGLARRGTPIVAWIAVFVALGFGVVLGFFFFSKQKPPETIVKYVEVAAKGTDQPTALGAQTDQGNADSAASAKAGKGTRPPGGGKAVATNGTTSDKGATGGGLAGLKGLSGLSPGGPGSPGGSTPGTTPGGGGGQLDAAQIQGTVSRYTGAVKRRCWQPALDGRDPSAPSTARVVVTIGVAGSGSVTSVSTSGDPRGYPGLSNCIASSVRAWTFPATGGSSTAVVPFVFAAQ
jgi:predicted Zn finger-like uncharacterized protein